MTVRSDWLSFEVQGNVRVTMRSNGPLTLAIALGSSSERLESTVSEYDHHLEEV